MKSISKPTRIEYIIEGGCSSPASGEKGEIGFVSYIRAESPEKALEAFQDAVGEDSNDLEAYSNTLKRTVKVLVYFNPSSLTVTEHVQEADSDDLDDSEGDDDEENDES